MNDLFKETFETPVASKQTPIEIALGVDAQGMSIMKDSQEADHNVKENDKDVIIK